MPENKMKIEDYSTVFQFAKKHGIPTKDKSKMASLNRAADKLSKIYIKNPAGNLVQTVYRNRKCHNKTSMFLIPPFSDKPVLEEYNNQELIKAQKAAKGVTK